MFGALKILTEKPLFFEKEWPDFRMFAIRCHGDQRYGTFPYAYHLATVEAYLMECGYSEHHYQAAAWLHDVVEDTATDIDRIMDSYGPIVAGIVYCCTGNGTNRKARNESIFAKLKEYPLAAPIKVADRLANTLFSLHEARRTGNTKKLQMYVDEYNQFKEQVASLITEEFRGRMLWNSLDEAMDKATAYLNESSNKKVA